MLSILHFGSVRERAALLGLFLVMALLSACGAPFTGNADAALGIAGAAGELSDPAFAGGSGAPMTTPSAGAAGLGAPESAGAAGALNAGAGGSPTTAPDAGAGGAGVTCVASWRGSSCDTCTSSPAPASGRSCGDVLDCYAEHACTPETCAGLCDYSAPTSDAAVKEAHRVAACRCAGGL